MERLVESRPATRRLRSLAPYLALLPFAIYVLIFLIWPTYIVVVGAFQSEDGSATLQNLSSVLAAPRHVNAFLQSFALAGSTAVIGGVFGALLAWAVSGTKENGVLRSSITALSGVLAQFGGVMLAFAFLATFGFSGFVTAFLQEKLGLTIFSGGAWLYSLGGLVLVYTYFQIPLMLIVFSPAIDNLKSEWRQASDSLGGSSWAFWRHVGGPILAPSFFGAMLLLFANAFSSYSTAYALINQGSPIVPLKIGSFLTSEVSVGNANIANAMAFYMVIIVAIIMTGYALLQRRTSKWLQ